MVSSLEAISEQMSKINVPVSVLIATADTAIPPNAPGGMTRLYLSVYDNVSIQ